MKKGWEIKTLGEVYDVRDGTHDSPKYLKEGFALITSKNLKNDSINYNNVNYISEEDYVNINKRSKVDRGDVLFAMIGTIGNPVVIENDPEFAVKNVALFKVPQNQSSYFLKYYLDSRLVIDKMSKDAKGATQKFVGLGYLRNFPIPLPPLPEQVRIVSILDEAFASIAKAKANAEQNLKNARELFESYLQSVFANKGEGWEEKKLGDVCEMINRGISPKYAEKAGLIVLNQKCIRDHRVSFEQSRFHDDSVKKVSSEKFIRIGDVLVNSTGTGTLGRVAQVRNDFKNVIVDSHITIVRPLKDSFYRDFFGWALIFIEDEIAKRGEGCGGQTELSRNALKNDFTIGFPKSISTQQTIVHKLDTLSSKTKILESIYQQKLNDLEEMKKSILEKAFNGELKES